MRTVFQPLAFLCLLAGCGTLEEVIIGNAAEETSDVGIWRCLNQFNYAKYAVRGDFPHDKVLAALTPYSEEAGVSARVSVAGVDYAAVYYVQGIDRRWDFGDELKYTFVVRPDGSTLYYDFSRAEEGEEIPPKQTFFCVSQ